MFSFFIVKSVTSETGLCLYFRKYYIIYDFIGIFNDIYISKISFFKKTLENYEQNKINNSSCVTTVL